MVFLSSGDFFGSASFRHWSRSDAPLTLSSLLFHRSKAQRRRIRKECTNSRNRDGADYWLLRFNNFRNRLLGRQANGTGSRKAHFAASPSGMTSLARY